MTATAAPSAMPASSRHGRCRVKADRIPAGRQPQSSARERSRSWTANRMAASPNRVTKASSIPIRDWTMCRKSPASRAAAVNAPKVRALGDAIAQELPGQQEQHRHRDDADHRRRDAPAELLVAEQLDAGPDHPVAERRVCAAGELVDAAFGRADDVAARVAGVPDLVEHEAHRAAQPRQTQRGGARRHRQERDPVEARPAGPAVDVPVLQESAARPC